jgi:signal transduction histidine kinase
MAMQAEKIAATGRMAAAVAHEINNPLASVLNLIFLARQDDASKQEIQTYLTTAESELERVSHIARQTLGYYRDTGAPSEVHLHDLMENVLSVYKSRLFTLGIVVEARFEDLRKISVRSGEIVQVFSNVISNAMDAMPHGGTLSLSITAVRGLDRDGFQAVIKDTGHGIQSENLVKVFEPFFTTKGNLGNGIGLWVARQLVERHGGQISISSNTERGNSGTAVTLYLPFNGAEGEMPASNEPKSGTEAHL